MKFAQLHYFSSQNVGGNKRYYVPPCPKVGGTCPTHKLSPCILVKAPLCFDWRGQVASAQSFPLSHQATIKIPRRAHLISACSRHMGVVLHTHPFVVNRTFTTTLRGCNTCSKVGLDFLK